MSDTLKNWAGNLTYSAATVHYPQTVAEVQAIVKKAQKIRGLGSRHSFNTIADCNAEIISLKHLNKVIGINKEARTVTAEGGITYGQLCPYLNDAGYALHNLASLPHISVVGACMTATHGSGSKNGNLATAVSSLEIVTANGEISTLSRDDEAFYAAVVGLGGFGIVTKITLAIVPKFEIRQDLYLDLPYAALEDNFDTIMSSAYSVSLFNNWQGEHINQIWLKSLADTSFNFTNMFYGARRADKPYHPLPTMGTEHCTEQLGVVGAWHERLPHFRFEFTPSAGEELQSEFFVARDDAFAALTALQQIQGQIAPHLLISEIRMIAADKQWMSPCYQQDCVAFHFTWKQNWPAVKNVLPAIEAQLAPLNARPHWGKLFTMPAAVVQARYATKLLDFRHLLQQYDPDGKFRNDFLNEYIF